MNTLHAAEISALMAQGWSLVSETPLRIRHDESGDEASGIAAEMVARQVVSEWDEEGSCVPQEDMRELFQRLQALATQAQHYWSVAHHQAQGYAAEKECPAWETAFSLIFNPQLSDQVATVLRRMGQPLSYDDPDGSYEEDVLAYVNALNNHVARMSLFLVPEPLAA